MFSRGLKERSTEREMGCEIEKIRQLHGDGRKTKTDKMF